MNETRIPLVVVTGEEIPLSVASNVSANVDVDLAVIASVGEHYDGPLLVTPGEAAQILDTAGKIVDGEIAVEAIPNCYGLISWNGAVLTVS